MATWKLLGCFLSSWSFQKVPFMYGICCSNSPSLRVCTQVKAVRWSNLTCVRAPLGVSPFQGFHHKSPSALIRDHPFQRQTIGTYQSQSKTQKGGLPLMLPQFFNIEHTATSFENTGRDDSNCWYSTSSLCSSSKLLMRPATACIAVGWTVAACDSWARCEKQLNGKTRLESWLHTQFGTSDLGPIFGIPPEKI